MARAIEAINSVLAFGWKNELLLRCTERIVSKIFVTPTPKKNWAPSSVSHNVEEVLRDFCYWSGCTPVKYVADFYYRDWVRCLAIEVHLRDILHCQILLLSHFASTQTWLCAHTEPAVYLRCYINNRNRMRLSYQQQFYMQNCSLKNVKSIASSELISSMIVTTVCHCMR